MPPRRSAFSKCDLAHATAFVWRAPLLHTSTARAAHVGSAQLSPRPSRAALASPPACRNPRCAAQTAISIAGGLVWGGQRPKPHHEPRQPVFERGT
jgi:hypothetical protein